MFSTVLATLFLTFVQIFAFPSNVLHNDDFSFPLEKSDDSNSCTFKNGTVGRCVNASECPNAHSDHRSGINPTICHFENQESVICCLMETSSLAPRSNFTRLNTTDIPEAVVVVHIKPKEPVQNPVERRKSVAYCKVYSLTIPADRQPDELDTSIVHGEVTKLGEFPHMAALGWTADDKKIIWRCGGTLISLYFVLTAAHCVILRTPPDIIKIGETDLIATDTLNASHVFGVESIIGHPNYKTNKLYDDIALIKLNKRAVITSKVRPACLWQTNALNFTVVVATGYGDTEFGGIASNKLLKVDLEIFDSSVCAVGYQNERKLQNGIVDSQICAGDPTGEKDTCQGDSGGPIVGFTVNRIRISAHVIGITSFGFACATTLPGVYTRVSHYLEWIENIVWP